MISLVTMHQEKSTELLVIGYPQDWHWALSIEYFVNRSRDGQSFHILDLSFAGRLDLRGILKRMLGGNQLRKTGLQILRVDSNASILKRGTLINNFRAFFDTFSEIRRLRPTLNFENSTTIYNSCVEKSGSLNPVTRNNFVTIFREVLARNLTWRNLEILDSSKYTRVVTVNGRFTVNAVTKAWASNNSIPCMLIEFGSSKESFQTYAVSPHSMLELEGKIVDFWDSAEESFKLEAGMEYLKKLSEDKPITEINWRAKMQRHMVPPKLKPYSCVFFTSTEAEYAGVGDQIPPSNYQNQVQAFRDVVDELPTDEWQIFLRRHPSNPNDKVQDAEHLLWQEFEKNPKVFIIGPESPIDSIALGMSADLVLNFCSIIAMELVARGAQNVITMGPSPWQGLLPERQVESNFSLTMALEIIKSKVSPERILPFCFYSNKHGFSFQITRYSDLDHNWKHIVDKSKAHQ